MSVALRHSMHRERTALPEQPFLTPYGWACTTRQERKRLIRLITAALCKSTSSRKWNGSMTLTPARSPATHPSHPVTLTLSLCSVTCHRCTPFKPPPMHMWRSTDINYAQLQLELPVGVVEEGNEIKGMLLESICARSLFWVQPLLFAMMHTSCM